MYLLVFVTLVIGLVGIYAQVLSLQAARLASSITALGNNMVEWHVAAVSMASNILYVNGAAAVPVACSLTYTPPPGGPSPCTAPNNSGDATGTVTAGTTKINDIYVNGKPVPVHLPDNYNYAQVQFYSILYPDPVSGHYYVVTYVLPARISANNPAPGFLALPPTGNYISYTAADLMHQLSISKIPDYSYGTAESNGVNQVLISSALLRGEVYSTNNVTKAETNIEYNLPPIVGSGSIAIVSPPSNF